MATPVTLPKDPNAPQTHFAPGEKADVVELEHHVDGCKDGQIAAPEVESKFADLNKKQTIKTFWRSIAWAVAAGIGALFDGYSIVIPGSIVANPGFIAHFSTMKNAAGKAILDPQVVGAWGGIQSGGQIFAMWTGPFISDRFGRKTIMYIFTLIVGIAVAIEITAKNWRVYAIARLLNGMAVGFVQSGITVYIAEVSVPQIRGSMLSFYSVTYNLGGLCASIALKIVVGLRPEQFKNAFYSQIVFIGIFLPILPFIPESPWYYARRHDHENAKKMMVRLYGNVPGWNVDEEYEVVRKNVQHAEALQELQNSSTMKELFTGTNGRRTFVAWLAGSFGSFCGLSLVLGYTSYFFGLAGLKDPFLASLIIKLILNIFTICSFFTVDHIGRRPSLLGGGAIMGLMMLIIGVLRSANKQDQGTAIVVLFGIHAAAYAMSAGPLGWTFVGETATPRLRAKTAGLAAGGTAAFGLLFNYTTPIMLANPGANWGLYIGYFWAGLTAVAWTMLYFFVPETKGRTWNELDELFERKIPARKFASTKTTADDLRASAA